MTAFAIACSASHAQQGVVYVGEDPLETDVYIFHPDSTFRHYSKSLGKFYCGGGEWYDEGKVRTISFGVRDTTTLTIADPGWRFIDTTGISLQLPVQERGPSLHFFKVKKDRLMYYDYRYSVGERMRGERAGYLIKQTLTSP